MTFSLLWIRQALLDAQVKVATVDGWDTRGNGDMGPVRGVICHHTAGSRQGNMPSLRTLIDGRPDLKGPLSQLGLGRDGTFYVIAAGRANHAGAGSWLGITNGNDHFIGIEAENTGLDNDQPWPEVQIDAYCRGVAALLKHQGLSEDACAGHKEYALPHGRKIDPTFDMKVFRARVSTLVSGQAPAPVLIPALEPNPARGKAARPTLRRGSTGDPVSLIQKLLGIGIDGKFGPGTEARVRTFQRERALVPDGIVGPKSWLALDQIVV
jgi:hypothetical protein